MLGIIAPGQKWAFPMPNSNITSTVAVSITKKISDGFPGFIAFELIDTAGQIHRFEDKVPVVYSDDLSNLNLGEALGIGPIQGRMRCCVVEVLSDGVVIDTSRPDGIETLGGINRFKVPLAMLEAL